MHLGRRDKKPIKFNVDVMSVSSHDSCMGYFCIRQELFAATEFITLGADCLGERSPKKDRD